MTLAERRAGAKPPMVSRDMPQPDYKNPILRIMLGREFREATGRWPSAQEIDDIDLDLRADILDFDALTDYLYEHDSDILMMKQRNKSRQRHGRPTSKD